MTHTEPSKPTASKGTTLERAGERAGLEDAALPSLARAFEPERSALREQFKDETLGAAQIVTLARRALDDAGKRFSDEARDPSVQRAGLWLLEMVKSGASLLDQGVSAQVVWQEQPKTEPRQIAGSTLFYGAAAVFFLAGMWQGERTVMMTATALALLRFFDPADWSRLVQKIPLIGRFKKGSQSAGMIDSADGRRHLAQARLSMNGAGVIDGLADALRTADHVLIRLAQPVNEAHWKDDTRLLGLMQGLLEAKNSDDGHFALRLIETELSSLLRSENIEAVSYGRNTKRLFDILPGIELEPGLASSGAPALISGEQVLRRGTVWSSDG